MLRYIVSVLVFLLMGGLSAQSTDIPSFDLSEQPPFDIQAVIQQNGYLKASNADTFDSFGYSVAIDGDTVIVGAPYEASDGSTPDNNSTSFAGAAYIFVRQGDAWVQQAYLKASNADADDYFGASVAISGDTVIVGARNEDSDGSSPDDNSAIDAGAAYIFVRNGNTWVQQAYLKASNAHADDYFGASVAISGDTVIVGVYGEDSDGSIPDDNSANFAGAAYIFVRDGTTWTQQAYLKADNVGEYDYFGYSVAISGDTVIVGAQGESSNGSSSDDNSAPYAGAAYIFVHSGADWVQQAYLKASNADVDDSFGSSVAISGDTAIVGAYGEYSDGSIPDDNSAYYAGAAYIFVRNDAAWVQQAYLKASNTEEEDRFGFSVAISDDTAIVGVPYEASDGSSPDDN